ncbi:TetR/AcrR family transcriptional regulator [Breznakiella homolactica]|uniref:TetR/AcrR family transcriptional regulator n=1 Tax=Breznakiella homolactica TaxID=2798577 RepID=A0A7T7XQ38_9SPIR|nr:TetR/AcrR family transcriptional regulator [Breznakiella homolactica]QQO10454.1 TetR/AcrR family transcriptional regulator [Breznakiella homolactica]
MARISKSPEERKQEIITTALTLFEEKGYENTTIQDIAERMNAAQGLCYRYFKSKQEIFAASSDFYAQKAVENMRQSIRGTVDAIGKFNAVIQSLLTYAAAHGEFESSYRDVPEISAERIRRIAVHISDILIPIVEQGQREGVFHCDDISGTVRILSYGIINLIHSEMPKKNVPEHIVSFVPTIRRTCKILLGSEENRLGRGWGKR